MAGAVLLAIALVLGAAATSLAWRQVRLTSAPLAGAPVALASALKRLPLEERLGELARRAQQGSWEHQLAVDALAAPDKAAQVAAVNLALADMEHALTEGAAWPRTGVRIALLGAGLLASAAYIADGDHVRWWLSIVASGVVAALACVEAGRAAERNAVERRRAIDELVAATFGADVEDRAGSGNLGGRNFAPRRGVSSRRGRRF